MNFPIEKWCEAMKSMPAADRSAVIGAVCDYIHFGYDTPKLQGSLMALFSLIRLEVDAIKRRRMKARKPAASVPADVQPPAAPKREESTVSPVIAQSVRNWDKVFSPGSSPGNQGGPGETRSPGGGHGAKSNNKKNKNKGIPYDRNRYGALSPSAAGDAQRRF